MRRNALWNTALFAALLAIQFAAGPLAAADKVPSDKLLPPTVYAYISIPNITELKSRFMETSTGALVSDPALNDFWAEIKPKLDDASGELTKNLGVSLNDLLALPTGEFAVAYAQPEGKQAALVGLLDYGESEEVVEKLLKKAQEALEEQGATRSVQDFEGTEIVVYTFGKSDSDAADKEDSDEGESEEGNESVGSTLAYFLKDSYVVAGSNVAILETVLGRWSGESESTFATNEVYRYILDKCRSGGTKSVADFYVDPIGLATNLIGTYGQQNFAAQMALGFLPAIGLTNFKAIGGSVDFGGDEYDSVVRAFAYVEQPTTGLLNVLRFPATEQSPPKWVSEDATTYFAINWDVEGAYGAVEELVDTFQGPGALEQIIDELAESGAGPQVHIKKDIIDQLTGSIHVVSDMADPDDVQSSRFLVALGVKDETKIKALLAKVAESEGFPAEQREFEGTLIYEMDLPVPGQTEATKMGVCFAHNAFMFSTNVTLLESVIRASSDQPTLADSDEYKHIAKHFPDQTSLLGFQNQRTEMKALYEVFRSGQGGEMTGGALEGVDFSKLPPFETIEHHLLPTGTYAIPDERGALIVSFSVKK